MCQAVGPENGKGRNWKRTGKREIVNGSKSERKTINRKTTCNSELPRSSPRAKAVHFSFFSSGLLHFSQILCSLAASLQHECGQSLPCAIALSQQLLASFWHFSQSLCSLCALMQHSWSHSFPLALAFTQQLWLAREVLTPIAKAKANPANTFFSIIGFRLR